MIVTSSPKSGYDSWVDSGNTHTEHGSGSRIQLTSTNFGFLWMPITPLVNGTTIVSATLTGHAHGSAVSQLLVVHRVAAKWEAGKINFANMPGVTSTTVSPTLPALVDGQQFTVDVTTLVQEIASGASHFGWRLAAATGMSVVAFNSGQPAWGLSIEFGEAPDPPSGLAPDGTVAGAGKPVVSWDATDFGGDETDIAAAKVQVDSNLDGTVDWDSGWVAQTVTTMDLAAAGMTGTITSGQSVNWRVAVQDDDGGQSALSDWAQYTYRPQPTLTLDSPSGGTMYDPTSDVLAHISTALLGSYRIQVTDGDDQTSIRYDSGKRQATDPSNIALTLPLRNSDGSRIFTDDLAYQIHVRAWDTYDRQSTPGVPAHVDQWETITFNDDLALTAVPTVQARQVGVTPITQVTWTDTSAGDAYLISRDQVHIAKVAPADVVTGSSGGVTTFAWTDTTPQPFGRHIYSVRRITNGVGRSPATRDSILVEPLGLWLVRANGDSVQLVYTAADPGVQLSTQERRAIYNPVNLAYPVDILTAYEGLSGPIGLSLVNDQFDQDVDDAIAVLSAIKAHSTETVRLVYADVSKPMVVSNMSVVPVPTSFGGMGRLYSVTFNVNQVGEFDWTIASGTRGGVAGIG